ncbi:hypothetical protein EE612_053361, partial [Oryza sativa]
EVPLLKGDYHQGCPWLCLRSQEGGLQGIALQGIPLSLDDLPHRRFYQYHHCSPSCTS